MQKLLTVLIRNCAQGKIHFSFKHTYRK